MQKKTYKNKATCKGGSSETMEKPHYISLVNIVRIDRFWKWINTINFTKQLNNMGLLDAAAAITQSLIDRKTQMMNVDKTFEVNKNLADYQYSKDLEMWNKANAYNTPEAQMERFKVAGLNPNLIYGQGTSGNTSTSLPKYQAPTYKRDYIPLNVLGALSSYQDLAVKGAQINNLRKQNEILSSEAVAKRAFARYADDLYGYRAEKAFNDSEIQKFKRIWGEQEFKRMFELRSDNKWYVKPEMEDSYLSMLSTKWERPTYELGKTQADSRKAIAQAKWQESMNDIFGINAGSGIAAKLAGVLQTILRLR